MYTRNKKYTVAFFCDSIRIGNTSMKWAAEAFNKDEQYAQGVQFILQPTYCRW